MNINCPHCDATVTTIYTKTEGLMRCRSCHGVFNYTVDVQAVKPERRKLAEGLHYADDPPDDHRDILLVYDDEITTEGWWGGDGYISFIYHPEKKVIGWLDFDGVLPADLNAMSEAAS